MAMAANSVPALGLANAGFLVPQVSSRCFGPLPAFSARSDLQNSALPPLLSARLRSGVDGSRRGKVVAMATGETSTDTEPLKPISEVLRPVQEAWEKTDDKLAIGGLGFAAVIVLWASTGLIAAIDKLPILPSAFEFIGILFSGWFIYRYLLFKPDREALWEKIEGAISKITGE